MEARCRFHRAGRKYLPIVRDQNRRLTERVGKLEGEITSFRSTAGEQYKSSKNCATWANAPIRPAMIAPWVKSRPSSGKRLNPATPRLMTDWSSRPKPWKVPDQELTARMCRQNLPRLRAPRRAGTSTSLAAVEAFVSENKWFDNDAFLPAGSIDGPVGDDPRRPDFDEAEQLAEAKSRIMEEFPERLEQHQCRANQLTYTAAPRRRRTANAGRTRTTSGSRANHHQFDPRPGRTKAGPRGFQPIKTATSRNHRSRVHGALCRPACRCADIAAEAEEIKSGMDWRPIETMPEGRKVIIKSVTGVECRASRAVVESPRPADTWGPKRLHCWGPKVI